MIVYTWKRLPLLSALCGLALLAVSPAEAQLNGSHTLGDFGVNSGTQPAPGFYAALFYYNYDTDTINDADGSGITLAPGNARSLDAVAIAPMVWWVSNAKLFGANYGMMVVLPWANTSIEAPAFGLDDTVDTSFADVMIRPLDLGWHTERTDVKRRPADLRAHGPVRTGRRRQYREGHVDVRAVRGGDVLL